MNRNIKDKPVLALFDFDGTISNRDSLPLFIAHTNPWVDICLKSIKLGPLLVATLAGLGDRSRAKEKLLASFYKGFTETDMKKYGQYFVDRVIDKFIRPAALEKIDWHKERGHTLAVISASPELWIVPWSQKNGLIGLGTRLEFADSIFTGRFEGMNCVAEEKVRRAQQAFGHLEDYYIYAYGDSKGDKAMLDLADEAYYKPF